MEFLCLVKLPLREKRLLIWQQLPASYTKGFQIWHSSLIISFRAAACFADVYNEGLQPKMAEPPRGTSTRPGRPNKMGRLTSFPLAQSVAGDLWISSQVTRGWR